MKKKTFLALIAAVSVLSACTLPLNFPTANNADADTVNQDNTDNADGTNDAGNDANTDNNDNGSGVDNGNAASNTGDGNASNGAGNTADGQQGDVLFAGLEDMLYEVPEHIAERGIILRGKKIETGNSSYREALIQDSESSHKRWNEDFLCDCNVSVESEEQDFIWFIKDFSFYDDKPEFTDNEGLREANSAILKGERGYCQIFRTSLYIGDLKDGMIYIEDDPGYFVRTYYDVSGKYMLMEGNEMDDEVLLKFLEPEMKTLNIFSTKEGVPNSLYDHPAVIEAYTDAIHSLELTLTQENPEKIIKGKDTVIMSFTSKDGRVFDYCLVGDKYLINDANVYSIENSENLVSLMTKEYRTDYESQLKIIAADYDYIIDSLGEDSSKWYQVAVMDLNRNGRLEVFVSTIQGSGAFSTTHIFEVNASYEYIYSRGISDRWTDMPVGDFTQYDSLNCYKKDGDYYYAVEDYTSTGWDLKGSRLYVYSLTPEINEDTVCGYTLSPKTEFDTETIEVRFYDKDGNGLDSEDEFRKYITDYWKDYEKQPCVSIKWMPFPERDECLKVLRESMEGYSETAVETRKPLTDFRKIYGSSFEYEIMKYESKN